VPTVGAQPSPAGVVSPDTADTLLTRLRPGGGVADASNYFDDRNTT